MLQFPPVRASVMSTGAFPAAGSSEPGRVSETLERIRSRVSAAVIGPTSVDHLE